MIPYVLAALLLTVVVVLVCPIAHADVEDCFPYQAQADKDAAAQNWTATNLDNAKVLECLHANMTG